MRFTTSARFRNVISVIAATTVAALAVACGSSSPTSSSSPPPTSEATGTTPQNSDDLTAVPSGKVTITVSDWDNSEAMTKIIAAFNKKYPQITVKHQYTSASDFQKTLKLVMQSDNPPDIVQYNTPIRDLGAAGLVLDLTPYEKAYHWDDTVSVSLLDQTRFSADGKTMGEGKLLAAPISVPIVGVFYNKKLTKKAGITTKPKTIADFTDDLKKVKDAGIQPLEMGSLDFGGIHNWAAIVNSYSNTSDLRNWLFGTSGATIDNDAASRATTTMQNWAKSGYYPESANGTSDADAAAHFGVGKSAYLIDGSWQAGAFEKALGDDVGFFLLPMAKAGEPVIANASVAAYSVSSKSKHQRAAVAFLNFFYNKQAAPGVTFLGNMSVNPQLNTGFAGVAAEVAHGFSQISQSDGGMIFPDQSAPALLDLLTSDVQKLVAQKLTPVDMLKDVQSSWADYHS